MSSKAKKVPKRSRKVAHISDVDASSETLTMKSATKLMIYSEDNGVIELFTTDEESDRRSTPESPSTTAKWQTGLKTERKDLKDSVDSSSSLKAIYISSDESESEVPGVTTTPRKRRISHVPAIRSDCIDITSDSSSDSERVLAMLRPNQGANAPRNDETPPPALPSSFSPWERDDGSILIFDEPKSARKPIKIRTPKVKGPLPKVSSSAPSIVDDDDAPASQEDSKVPPIKRATRKGKRANAALERARLENYASELFADLNEAVFQNGLPKNTQLIWSKRLLTTAGRAKWHRKPDGGDDVEIELAAKVLDCEERIRNTLSHEMCHLASWLISKQPREHHGSIFKSWAAKVTRERPEITVSTKHSYDINYKYEWKCSDCSKIYGRHSKSIDPNACRCGACKTGKLVPLFATRTTKVKGPKSSRNAGASQGSPVKDVQPSPLIFHELTDAIVSLSIEDE